MDRIIKRVKSALDSADEALDSSMIALVSCSRSYGTCISEGLWYDMRKSRRLYAQKR